MQAVSHFHSELGLFMMFLKICFILYFDELYIVLTTLYLLSTLCNIYF